LREGIRYWRGEIHYSTISNGCERLRLNGREKRVGNERWTDFRAGLGDLQPGAGGVAPFALFRCGSKGMLRGETLAGKDMDDPE